MVMAVMRHAAIWTAVAERSGDLVLPQIWPGLLRTDGAAVVAQISNLLSRRIPFGKTSAASETAGRFKTCGLEIRDTAGWKPVGNLRYTARASSTVPSV